MSNFNRTISSRIFEEGRFLKLKADLQMLYVQLCLHADDEGIVEGAMCMLLTRTTEDHLKKLEEVGLIKILNDDGVVFIQDWKEHSILRNDRVKKSKYHSLLYPQSAFDCEEENDNDSYFNDDNDSEPTEFVEDYTSESPDCDKGLTSLDISSDDNSLSTCHDIDKEMTENVTYKQKLTKTNRLTKKKKNNTKKEETLLSDSSVRKILLDAFPMTTERLDMLFLEFINSYPKVLSEAQTISFAKHLFCLSDANAETAEQIVDTSIRRGYKDFFKPAKIESSIPGKTITANFTQDRTSQYDNDIDPIA